MVVSLYEQFLAVGSVKSLLTGKEILTLSPFSFEKNASPEDSLTSNPPPQTEAADIQQK